MQYTKRKENHPSCKNHFIILNQNDVKKKIKYILFLIAICSYTSNPRVQVFTYPQVQSRPHPKMIESFPPCKISLYR